MKRLTKDYAHYIQRWEGKMLSFAATYPFSSWGFYGTIHEQILLGGL